MATVNERLQDAEVGHQVNLHRFSNNVVRKILALLNRVDSDLFAQLSSALERLPSESFTVERLEMVLGSVRALNLQAYQALDRELTPQLRELAGYETEYQIQLFQATVPRPVLAQMPLHAVSVEQVFSAVVSRPFQGRVLREWASSLEAGRMTRMRDAIRMGYVEGQTTSQIVQRVRGTRAKGYADGIIEIDRRNAEAVVRTAVSHTAATTRDRFYEDNTDVIKAVAWTSTLDSRTTLHICVPRDGKQYHPVTHKPIGHSLPWLGGPGRAHWNCRSSSVPITKSFKELGIDLDDLPPTERASMDGTVPAETTYIEWLQKQSASRQDDILGSTRGALLRQGGLKADRFYNDKGRYLTLDELRQRDAAAFQKAGV